MDPICATDGYRPAPFEFEKVEEHSYFFEAGGGLNSSLTEDNRHQLFANVVGFVGPTYDHYKQFGASPWNTMQWTGGIDTNVGYFTS